MSPLEAKIAAEIKDHGSITFARFMELALYCPVYGYYETEKDKVGARGDYYTSVSVGPLFGQLLAVQFTEWLAEVGQPHAPGSENQGDLCLIEAGAHDGRLAEDLLDWFQRHEPGLWERLRYWIVEPSERRQAWQKERLRRFGTKVAFTPTLETLSSHRHVRGVLFSNELLDAMPVRRLGWDARLGTWFEWGVGLFGERLSWARLEVTFKSPAVTSYLEQLPADLLNVLPDGFTVEVSPAAAEWWESAAKALNQGYLLTCDYGLTAGELLAPHRTKGTLRAYYRHKIAEDLLARPGEQDLTAHVNFSSLQKAGERAGLQTVELSSQAKFLTRIAERIWTGRAKFDDWTPRHTAHFRTLTHPEHLGRAFKVLIQRRFWREPLR